MQFTDAVKSLGVTLDSELNFDRHVTNVVLSGTYHTRALRHIKPLLTTDDAKMIACAIVDAMLRYCNNNVPWTSTESSKVHLSCVVLSMPWSARHCWGNLGDYCGNFRNC